MAARVAIAAMDPLTGKDVAIRPSRPKREHHPEGPGMVLFFGITRKCPK